MLVRVQLGEFSAWLLGIVELPSGLTPELPMEDVPPVYRTTAVHIGDGSIGPMPFYVKAYPWPPDTEGFLGNALFRAFRVVIDPTRGSVHLSSLLPGRHVTE